jgi:F0F1-type ATP synthase delta subunit
MAGLSRRKIATYAATKLLSGETTVVKEIAAYLIDEGRTNEVDLVVRDIETELSRHGVVVAEVISAHELTNATLGVIKEYVAGETGTKDIRLRTSIDEDLIGGFKLKLPDGELDETVAKRLSILRASKV